MPSVVDLQEPLAMPSRLMVAEAGEHPVHAVLRAFDGMSVTSMPPLARLALLSVAAECERTATGRIVGAVSLDTLARTTGIRPVDLRGQIESLARREWLFQLDETASDPSVATAYEVRTDGRPWQKGHRP